VIFEPLAASAHVIAPLALWSRIDRLNGKVVAPQLREVPLTTA
jgi:hypothetical protein